MWNKTIDVIGKQTFQMNSTVQFSEIQKNIFLEIKKETIQ